jgi:hypothetical protein
MQENIPARTQQNLAVKAPQLRIVVWMASALIITAISVDVSEMVITWVGLLVVGSILSNVLSFCATVMFFIWFGTLGVKMTNSPAKLASSIITVIVENVPGFDAVPLLSWVWTIGVIFMIAFSRMEDKGKEPSIMGAVTEIFTFASPAGIVINNTIGSSVRNMRMRKNRAIMEAEERRTMNDERESVENEIDRGEAVGQEVSPSRATIQMTKDVRSGSFVASKGNRPSPQNSNSIRKAA